MKCGNTVYTTCSGDAILNIFNTITMFCVDNEGVFSKQKILY